MMQTADAWGEYLSAYAWDHVIHLTTREPSSERALVREFLDRFVRQLARVAQRRVPYFYAVEWHVSGFPHLHGLVAGTVGISLHDIQRRWALGYTRIGRYSPDRGAAYYVSKSVGNNSGDNCDEYGISSRLPPLRRQVA